MQPSVSVIVPVYNIEQYIGKCLDSIIGQTLKAVSYTHLTLPTKA